MRARVFGFASIIRFGDVFVGELEFRRPESTGLVRRMYFTQLLTMKELIGQHNRVVRALHSAWYDP